MKFFHNFLASLLFFLICINSTFAIITNVIIPQGVLHGHKFTLKFLTEKSIDNTVQYYVIFGLHPGTNPVVGGNIGELVLTSPHSDLVEGGHSVTGHGSFKVDVMLPSNLKIKGKEEIFGLMVTIFQTSHSKAPKSFFFLLFALLFPRVGDDFYGRRLQWCFHASARIRRVILDLRVCCCNISGVMLWVFGSSTSSPN
ncbi:uncharacterized protein EI90DRAFT_3057977 [Cantharellus anzutake]|uniref:uncharacterized protein n=1 Tax=Cantharellus anzutake TaxID=1750568 RepID=UPI0019065772|nr:uncharacterized protein EI90DRAFT_3057977 [Cantharellus anzutake]KAF8331448.1 hypothetical protein EI90DRAFT_3057977 [Cantharellus anzutake]